MSIRFLHIVLCAFLLASCQREPKTVDTPWGSTMQIDGDGVGQQTTDAVTLETMRANGEMILLTLSGPDTYYDYHGHGMGVNYLLCEKIAEKIGVRLRVDVCKDTIDMKQRLRAGEGDIIGVPLKRKDQVGFINVGNDWVVSRYSKELARVIRSWYKPSMLAEMRRQEQYMLSVASVTRRVNPLMLSASKGQISVYDNLFRKYAPVAMVDWVMLASQCYQESCFDPKAHSWAGACGLMQIMPGTADHLSLPRERLYDPESNIAAAARYMRELQDAFRDVSNPRERLCFALAAYNGGSYHVRDAMALTKKYGGIPHRWSDVKRYILLLSQPQYYNDPVVKNGYMRGSETAQYVDVIMERHSQYRHALSTGARITSVVKVTPGTSVHVSPMEATPHRATRKNKWRKE